jgi:hypothetical protein
MNPRRRPQSRAKPPSRTQDRCVPGAISRRYMEAVRGWEGRKFPHSTDAQAQPVYVKPRIQILAEPRTQDIRRSGSLLLRWLAPGGQIG